MDHKAMVTLRTHLTVALLAIGQMRRSHSASPDALRLSGYATKALEGMREDLRKLDALIAKLEDRERIEADPLRLKALPRRGTATHGGGGGQGKSRASGDS